MTQAILFFVYFQMTLNISSAFDVTEIPILQTTQEMSEQPVDTSGKIRTTSFEVFIFTITQNKPSLTIDQDH
jgi:hypothetical protein